MTFYNVISGILFLSACQAFLSTLGSSHGWVAAVLVVTILNESVVTSDLIEQPRDAVPYKLSMKLVDFLAFSTFLWALLVFQPAGNAFNVVVSNSLWGSNRPWAFWLLLFLYWVITLWWNFLAGQLDSSRWRTWFFWWMCLMWVWPLIAAGWTWSAQSFDDAPRAPGIVALALVVAYLIAKIWARPANV